jgi:hypothetical protein
VPCVAQSLSQPNYVLGWPTNIQASDYANYLH